MNLLGHIIAGHALQGGDYNLVERQGLFYFLQVPLDQAVLLLALGRFVHVALQLGLFESEFLVKLDAARVLGCSLVGAASAAEATLQGDCFQLWLRSWRSQRLHRRSLNSHGRRLERALNVVHLNY